MQIIDSNVVLRTLKFHVVSSNCGSKNPTYTHIRSSHIGCFLVAVSYTIYTYIKLGYEIFMLIKEMTVDVRYVFVPAS